MEGLEAILNPFKTVNIKSFPDISKIGSTASCKAKINPRKSYPNSNPKFTPGTPENYNDKDSLSPPSDDTTVKTVLMRIHMDIVGEKKYLNLNVPLFSTGLDPYITVTVIRCLNKTNPK